VEAAFTALEDLKVFAQQRGVEVLLENIPNAYSSSERLNYFLGTTHLDLGYCFDVGHAHIMEGVSTAFERMKDRVRSTHVHGNDGVHDRHICPYMDGDGVDWKSTMELLRSGDDQYPLLLELKEAEEMGNPLSKVQDVFERLEKE
jgi:sugar phosphate isomerase/epimerase